MRKEKYNEEDVIRKALESSGGKAYQVALDKGIAVTILHENSIKTIHPDGSEEIIRTLSQSGKKKKVSRRFLLK